MMGDHLTPSIRAERPVDNGPLEEFEALYQRYFRRLVHDLLRRIPNRATAEDLAQETLVRAFVKLDRFDPERPLWPWIRGISRRILADHGRGLSREILADPPDAAGVPPELAGIEDRAVLSAALARLHPRHRVAMGLRYVQDWEPEHAAAFLGVSLAGFHQLLFRARERLRLEYRRLTDGVPALVAIRWLPREFRDLTDRVRRRITRLSTLPWSEPLSRAAASAALVALFALVPPIAVSDTPARAGPRPAADPGTSVPQLLEERSPGPAGHAGSDPAQEGWGSAPPRGAGETEPGPGTGDSPGPDAPPPEETPPEAPPSVPTPGDQPTGGGTPSTGPAASAGHAANVISPAADNAASTRGPPEVISVYPIDPLPIPVPIVEEVVSSVAPVP